MTSSLDALWEKLCDYQIVTGKRPGIRHQSSPWYVKLILAFSGWVAACFLLAFAGSLFAWVFKSTAASFIYGAILIGVAIVTLRRGHSDFTVHLGLALSVAGQAFVLWGIVNAFDDDIRSSALLILLVEIILLLLTNNFTHRVFSTFVACAAIYVALNVDRVGGVPENSITVSLSITFFALTTAWLWLNEFKLMKFHNGARAIAWGVTIALFVFESAAIIQRGNQHFDAGNSFAVSGLVWLTEYLLVGVLVWVVYEIIRQLPQINPKSKAVIIGSTAAIGLISTQAPGITVGIILLSLGFQQRYRVLQGLGLVSLGVYISRYYYLLEHTLAFKSAILALTGACLLLLRLVILTIANSKTNSLGAS
ncbi:MAG: DUF4401 domain-containing protein [Gammaproteobacteria bacterium]